jgi:ribonucleoside-diphosphate reductase alpha chain
MEAIQDAVQGELLLQGEDRVAVAYAAYRERRRQERAKLEQSVGQRTACFVRYGDGAVRCWGDGLWEKWLAEPLRESQLPLAAEELIPVLLRSLPDGPTLGELRNVVLSNALRRCKEDPRYGPLGTALGRQFLREEVFGESCDGSDGEMAQTLLREKFSEYIDRATALGLLDPRLMAMDRRVLARQLEPARDKLFDWSAFDLLYREFLLRDGEKIIELPQWFWMRVAMGLHVETEEKLRTEKIIELYGALSRLEFCPASTTLLYAGSASPHLLPSYVYVLEDNMQDIMVRGIAENAFASRWGAGLGGSWSHIRGRGSRIGGSRGISEGIAPFLDLHRHQLSIANQGSHRRSGAGCAYLTLWHGDVEEFIEFRKKICPKDAGGRRDSLRTCLWIPDLFMERLAEGKCQWTLFQPNEVPELLFAGGEEFADRYRRCEVRAREGSIWSKCIPVEELWQKILASVFETGFPCLAFSDSFQRGQAGAEGIVESSSLFGENAMALERGEVGCSAFGTVSLPAHLGPDGALDRERFCRTVRLAIETLDNVLSITKLHSAGAVRHRNRCRSLSLGLAGLHDLLRRQDVPFDSEAAARQTAYLFEVFSYTALDTSADLSRERGPCPAGRTVRPFLGVSELADSAADLDWNALREKVSRHGLRNGHLLAGAPTSRTAVLLAVSPGTLPVVRNLRPILLPSGERSWALDPLLLERLQADGLRSSELVGALSHLEGDVGAFPELPEDLRRCFASAFDLDPERLLSLAATIQRRIDQSQYLPCHLRMPTFHRLSSLAQSAWRQGIKVIGPLVSTHDLLRERARASEQP